MKIILIENAEITREKLMTILNGAGIKDIVVFENAAKALAYKNDSKIKIVITSIASDWKNNKDSFISLKEKFLAPVVVLSSIPESYIKEKILEKGADYFFDISTQIEEFIDFISKFLVRKRFTKKIGEILSSVKSLLN